LARALPPGKQRRRGDPLQFDVATPVIDREAIVELPRHPRHHWQRRMVLDREGPRGGEPISADDRRGTRPARRAETGRGRKPGEGDTTQPGILLPLLALPLEQIDVDRVHAWLKDEAQHRPTQANNAFVRLRAFLNWCSDRPEYRGQAHADACIARTARDELPKKTAKDK